MATPNHEKPLSEIIEELQRFPPDATVETCDGGVIVVHRGNETLGEVLTLV